MPFRRVGEAKPAEEPEENGTEDFNYSQFQDNEENSLYQEMEDISGVDGWYSPFLSGDTQKRGFTYYFV